MRATLHRLRRRQCDVQGFPLIEDEAVSVEVFAAGVLEVAQDAAVELQHVGDAGFGHQQCGLLAADAAGAIADDGLAFELVATLLQRLREVAEAAETPIERTTKAAV